MMKIGVYLSVGLLAASGLVAVACGDDGGEDCADCGTGAGGAGGGQGGSSSGVGGSQGGAGVGGSVGGGGQGGQGPTVCGGFAGIECASSDFCDFQPSNCGAADEQGLCEPRPQGCPDQALPVCGCDGNVHGNPCEAEAAGVDINTMGGCTPPDPGLFGCGPFFCDLATQYCQILGSDIGGEDDLFECVTLPACPTQLDCACLAAETCGDQCQGDPTVGFTLTCFGG